MMSPFESWLVNLGASGSNEEKVRVGRRRKWGSGGEEESKGHFLGGVGDGMRRRGQQRKNI